MDNFKVLKIDCPGEMGELVRILTNNGYEVNVKSVYETKEDLEAMGIRSYRRMKPNIKYHEVEIVGLIEKPVYTPD